MVLYFQFHENNGLLVTKQMEQVNKDINRMHADMPLVYTSGTYITTTSA